MHTHNADKGKGRRARGVDKRDYSGRVAMCMTDGRVLPIARQMRIVFGIKSVDGHRVVRRQQHVGLLEAIGLLCRALGTILAGGCLVGCTRGS